MLDKNSHQRGIKSENYLLKQSAKFSTGADASDFQEEGEKMHSHVVADGGENYFDADHTW